MYKSGLAWEKKQILRETPMSTLKYFDSSDTHRKLPYASVIKSLHEGLKEPNTTPPRDHHPLWNSSNTLLLMPSWDSQSLGVKLLSIYPENRSLKRPTIQGVYVLFDGTDGRPIAVADAAALTVRRTSAASALAATFLARKNSRTLLMVGAGALAPHLVRAHATVIPFSTILIWNRTPSKAHQMAQELSDESFAVEVVSDLQVACQEADLISCATRSTTPLIQGRWIKPGTHIDLVGGHAPEMREADENLICKARVFVDSFEAASLEAGDLIQPIRNGVFTWDEVEGDLFDLVQRESPARKSSHEITLFKSVGTAIEDLIAGRLLIGGDPL